ncbi:putative glycoside hydrolase, partial [Achaetomium macrosporum]
MLTKTLAIAALAAAPAVATPAVNVYWGSGPTSDRLRDYCDSTGFEYVTLGFVNSSPEQDPSGQRYAGTDFAAHCVAAKYQNPDTGVNSKLLSQCGLISADIRYCQSKGKKVLLSIGGQWNPPKADYAISSPPEGEYFADFIWGAFGPYTSAWKDKPRPFDDFYEGEEEGQEHFVFDGFDFDIEHKFDDQSGYVAMVRRLRALTNLDRSKKYLITAAPECPLSDQWFKMKTIIETSEFDALFVQFYNNAVCEGANNNFDDWAAFLANTASKDAKIFIGLPGSLGAAGSGYLPPSQARALINRYKNKPAFGGVMVWDAYYGSENVNGQPYYEVVHDVACGPPTTTTISTAPTATPTACVQTYTVKGGDNCYDISNKFGFDETTLRRLNPLLNGEC